MKCEEKIRYQTIEKAWLAAYKQFLKRKTEQSPYLCSVCNNYHLTTRKGRVPDWLVDMITKNHQ